MTEQQRVVMGDVNPILDALIARVKVTLCCPKCKRTKEGNLTRADPVGTSKVELLCPNCDPNGFDDVRYYDAKGNQLDP